MVTPLTFGNPLKFGSDSCHNTKGRLTFLHWERESTQSPAWTTLHTPLHTRTHIHHHLKGAFNGPTRRSVAIASDRTKAPMVLRLEVGHRQLFKQTNINIMHNGIVNKTIYDDPRKPIKQTSFTVKNLGGNLPKK